jgi:hypothetical protein
MGRCTTCRARIGFLGRHSRLVDGERHCTRCATGAEVNRFQRAADQLTDPEIRVYGRSKIIGKNPERLGSTERFIGLLLLTNRGVFYARYTMYKADQNIIILLGLLGAFLDQLIHNKRRRSALAELEPLNQVPLEDTASIAESAEDLFHFPPEQIRGIKADAKRLCLRRKGRKTLYFLLGGEKQENLEFRDTVREFDARSAASS